MARKLTDNEKEALALLKSLRSGEGASYHWVWNQITKNLGYKRTVTEEEAVKGMLIALATIRFGYDYRRDITLIALGLMENYNMLKVTKRRAKYLREEGYKFLDVEYEPDDKSSDKPDNKSRKESNDNEDKLTTDAIRKREDNYFKYLIIELSDGIKEDGEEYINELFNYAKGFNIVYYSNMKNDWIVRLPYIGDTVIDKFTSISKAKIRMTAMEERIVDEIHQRVLDGEKVINTAFILNTGDHYIGTLYYMKYQNLYDYMIGVCIDESGGKKNINLIISKMINDQEVAIYMPTEWLDLQILVDSIKRPIFNYIYESEDAKDDKEIFNYLKNKTGAVVFNPDFEGAYKEFK